MDQMRTAMMKAIKNRQNRSPASEEMDLFKENPIEVDQGKSLDQESEDPDYENFDEKSEAVDPMAPKIETEEVKLPTINTEAITGLLNKKPGFGDLQYMEYLNKKRNK